MGPALPTDVIYLDNNATTAPLEAVVDAMRPWLQEHYGNPSSTHRFGQQARFAVEAARRQVAALLDAAPHQVVLTSGGTESINLALRGLACPPGRRRQVIGAGDHPAVLVAAEAVETAGMALIRVGLDGQGRLDEAAYRAALDATVALVSLTHVNSETGVVEDVASLAAQARACGARVHVDAVQSAGKLQICAAHWPVDLVSIAAHKFHGPKGAGALYVRDAGLLRPLIAGGGQEQDLRGGTENVAAIVGMGVAAEEAHKGLEERNRRIAALRDRLERGLSETLPGVRVLSSGAARASNTSAMIFPGIVAERLLILLSEAGVCVSGGSACASGSVEPSHVLLAMGLDRADARCAVRFSLSHLTTEEQIERVMALVRGAVRRLEAMR